MFTIRPNTQRLASVIRRGFPAYFHGSLPARTGKVLEGDNANFEKLVEKAKEPVIVDFYANWCGPCKMLAPIIQQAVIDNKKVTLVKVDVDKNTETASKYKVTALPTISAFHKGQVVDTFLGLKDADFVGKFVKKAGDLGDSVTVERSRILIGACRSYERANGVWSAIKNFASMSNSSQTFTVFDAYDFENDANFQAGLPAILESNKEKSPTELETLVERAKCFYYSKVIQPIDYDAYIVWKNNKILEGIANLQEEITAPSLDAGSTSLDTTSSGSGTQATRDPKNADAPQYPRSFQEVCEMIANGVEIPVKRIPNEINKETPKESTLKPRPKPWEKITSDS